MTSEFFHGGKRSLGFCPAGRELTQTTDGTSITHPPTRCALSQTTEMQFLDPVATGAPLRRDIATRGDETA